MQSLGERLLSAEGSRNAADTPHAESLGDVAPRLQSADALRVVSVRLLSQQASSLQGGALPELFVRAV